MQQAATAYYPGLHIVCEFQSTALLLLENADAFRKLIDMLIASHGLQKVGEVYHQFEDAGYTAVICLTESHISIHTWPEYGRVTFDVFLSNYKRVNDGTARAIADEVAAFFEAHDIQKTELKR